MPSGIGHSIYQPSFGLLARKELMVGETVFRYAAGESLLCAADVPVTSQVTEASLSAPYFSIHLKIDPAVVADLLQDQGGRGAGEAGADGLAARALGPAIAGGGRARTEPSRSMDARMSAPRPKQTSDNPFC